MISFRQWFMHNGRPRRSFLPPLCIARSRPVAACLLVAMFGCGGIVRAQPAAQPPAGTTVETAIVLPNISDELHGVAAEHAYIARHHPNWHIENQATFEHDGHRYDRLGVAEPDASKTAIYFDITAWFGK